MAKFTKIQFLIILLGTIFAFYTVYQDYTRFFLYEESFFKFTNCLVPNPLITPCFYGAWWFLACLTIAFKLASNFSKKLQYKLVLLLIGGSIFGWSNMVWIFIKYIQAQGQPFVGCSGQITSNPFSTSCFTGTLFYTIAMITSVAIYKWYHKKEV